MLNNYIKVEYPLIYNQYSKMLYSLTISTNRYDNRLKRNEPNSPLPIKISSNGTNTIAATESYFSKMKIVPI